MIFNLSEKTVTAEAQVSAKAPEELMAICDENHRLQSVIEALCKKLSDVCEERRIVQGESDERSFQLMQLTEVNARFCDEVYDLISYRRFVSSVKKEKLPILQSLDDFSFAFIDRPENLRVLIKEDLRAELTRLV
jgi:hypothetical protein